MKKTKIEYCDCTWSPVTGCRHDCQYCYARRIANRFSYTRDWQAYPENLELQEPIIDAVSQRAAPYPHGFAPTFHRYRLDDPQKWKGPQNTFVCSMADLFGDWVPDEWIEDVFAACQRAPQHRYLFLTKNPTRYLSLAEAGKLPQQDNFWYGTTITDPDMPFFFAGGYNTFLSIEPMLAPFDPEHSEAINLPSSPKWIIAGAMTGPGSKGKQPKPEWVHGLVAAADKANIPVFMKDSLLPIVGEAAMRRDFPWQEE